jgi:hypothetical protein
MDAALLWQVGGQLAAALIAYGAVRADLRNMKERLGKIEDRFNQHIEKGLNHGNSQA